MVPQEGRGGPLVEENPALASYFEGKDGVQVRYQDVRAKNPPV